MPRGKNQTLLEKIELVTSSDADRYYNLTTGRSITDKIASSRARYIFKVLTPSIRIAAATQEEIDNAMQILAPDIEEAVPLVPNMAGDDNNIDVTTIFENVDTDLVTMLGPNGTEQDRAKALASGLSLIPFRDTLQGTNAKFQLLPHQRGIVNHIVGLTRDRKFNLNGVLVAISMGLGKTIIGLTTCLAKREKLISGGAEVIFPNLVIVSKSVFQVWRDSIDKFFQDSFKSRVLFLHQDYISMLDILTLSREKILKYDIIVTTYDFVKGAYKRSDVFVELTRSNMHKNIHRPNIRDNPDIIGENILFHTPFNRMVLDESHTIANPSTLSFAACMAISSIGTLLLSGTPIRNTDKDFWTQCRIMGYPSDRKNLNEVSSRVISMTYEQANITLPDREDIIHILDHSDKEKEFCERIKESARSLLGADVSFTHVLAMISMLRQAMNTCCTVKFEHPPDRDWYSTIQGTSGKQSAKMKKVVEILSFIKKGEKVLVFSSFIESMLMLASILKEKGYNTSGKRKYFYIDGSTDIKDRESIVSEFKTTKKGSVLMMSKKVGGEGWNLEVATTVIILEPWWCPFLDDQCIARSHRIGQTKNVTVHHLYIKDSIEDYILKTVQQKRKIASDIFEGIDAEGIQPTREAISDILA